MGSLSRLIIFAPGAGSGGRLCPHVVVSIQNCGQAMKTHRKDTGRDARRHHAKKQIKIRHGTVGVQDFEPLRYSDAALPGLLGMRSLPKVEMTIVARSGRDGDQSDSLLLTGLCFIRICFVAGGR